MIQLIFANYRVLLYFIGLGLVLLYLLMGVDDFIWDVFTLMLRPRYHRQRLDCRKLNTIPPKLLAVTVAAWHESNVLGDVIENIIESTDYPRSMYHIFLGVYPNDTETIAVAEALADRYENVHVIINDLPGPTSKAQNINHVIREIRQFEKERNWQFAALTIHDSEDVVHPFELRVTNYLLETHDALQFPVFPLMEMPRFRNFFRNLTTGTYADEFAENHFTTMVGRYVAGAFVPSAGTGFVLSRKTLESFGDGDVLPSDSLTEDYRLSLTLFQRGIRLYYVLERVPRVDKHGKLAWDYITTRSRFPNTFRTAVKQKTRWIYGITMQSVRLRDVFRIPGLPLAARYSLYKDLKAKVGNLLSMVGYPVLIYFFASLFVPLQPIYPKGSLSWNLSFVVTAMMVERQIFRSVAIDHVYGMRSVFFACLFPPLFPIRLIWGNIINMVSTFRAYWQKWTAGRTGNKRRADKKQAEPNRKKQIAWAKTDHEFLRREVLLRYHRTLGDILLEQGVLTPETLSSALKEAAQSGEKLGAYLRRQNLIDEQELLEALSSVKHIQYVTPLYLEDYGLKQFADRFDKSQLHLLLALPLLQLQNEFVFAFCDKSPINAQTILRNTYGISVKAEFLTKESILRGLELMYDGGKSVPASDDLIMQLFKAGEINYEQVILARNFNHFSGKTPEDILSYMGFMLPETAGEGRNNAACDYAV